MKKKRLTEISTIFFFSFLRESRSRLERDNVVFVEKISVKIVIMKMSLKKISSRWIINLEERVLVSRVKFFYLANFASRIHDGSILRLRDFSYI